MVVIIHFLLVQGGILFKKKFGYIRTIFYFKEKSYFEGLKLMKLTWVQKFNIFTVQLAHKNKKIWTAIELYGPVHFKTQFVRIYPPIRIYPSLWYREDTVIALFSL
jgi:hypothetical protein